MQAGCDLGDWGAHCAIAPLFPRRDWLLPSSPGGRAKSSLLDWPYFSISRKQHVGKPWGLSGSQEEEEGEHSGTGSVQVLLGLSQPLSD